LRSAGSRPIDLPLASWPRVEDAAAIVPAVAGLGSVLGMATNAEGGETRDRFVRSRHEGCSDLQGSFFARARPRSPRRGGDSTRARHAWSDPAHTGGFAGMRTLAPGRGDGGARAQYADGHFRDTRMGNFAPGATEADAGAGLAAHSTLLLSAFKTSLTAKPGQATTGGQRCASPSSANRISAKPRWRLF
jgi:hypothetical protein